MYLSCIQNQRVDVIYRTALYKISQEGIGVFPTRRKIRGSEKNASLGAT
jgi:hypothetical protein